MTENAYRKVFTSLDTESRALIKSALATHYEYLKSTKSNTVLLEKIRRTLEEDWKRPPNVPVNILFDWRPENKVLYITIRDDSPYVSIFDDVAQKFFAEHKVRGEWTCRGSRKVRPGHTQHIYKMIITPERTVMNKKKKEVVNRKKDMLAYFASLTKEELIAFFNTEI